MVNNLIQFMCICTQYPRETLVEMPLDFGNHRSKVDVSVTSCFSHLGASDICLIWPFYTELQKKRLIHVKNHDQGTDLYELILDN